MVQWLVLWKGLRKVLLYKKLLAWRSGYYSVRQTTKKKGSKKGCWSENMKGDDWEHTRVYRSVLTMVLKAELRTVRQIVKKMGRNLAIVINHLKVLRMEQSTVPC